MQHAKELHSIGFEWSRCGNFLGRLSVRRVLTLVEFVDTLALVKYRVIQNDCRSFNNLSYTIHMR